MSRRLITQHPRARQDIIGHALHLADQADAATADRFLRSLDQTLTMLAALPEMGSPRLFHHPKLKGVRVIPVRGFDHHQVFYRPSRLGIVVIRVLHSSRDLGAAP